MPQRIQLKRTKGWRLPPGAVVVSRPTKWGNPFVVHSDGHAYDRGLAVSSFRATLEADGSWWAIPFPWPAGKVPAGPPTTVEDVRRELRGKDLACWCPVDQPCHGDVLLEIANAAVAS